MHRTIVSILALAAILVAPGLSRAAEAPLTMGMLLVGPANDKGWSEAHHEAGKYVEKKLPGTKVITLDKVNPADRPSLTIPQVVDDMVAKGATLIFATSDDMKDGIREAAQMHPKVKFVHVSGDDVWSGQASANLGNLMGRMEYGKLMAGFAAGMTTQTGKIGYLGPLTNDETRRLANSAYLGAKHAWTKVRGKPAAEFKFQVSWIGFWFNIPGVTADPTQVSGKFFDQGADVIISGVDTPEALNVAMQRRKTGAKTFAVAYDYRDACAAGPEACLGVPYFNWGPAYLEIAKAAQAGTWKPSAPWNGPDWKDLNNLDTTAVGYMFGPALTPEAKAALETFVKDLGSGQVELFRGPLNYQDGAVWLKDGEKATDQKLWYCPQLLQGMEGQSAAK
jgi:simple sugar transport system substrate-binding protein